MGTLLQMCYHLGDLFYCLCEELLKFVVRNRKHT